MQANKPHQRIRRRALEIRRIGVILVYIAARALSVHVVIKLIRYSSMLGSYIAFLFFRVSFTPLSRLRFSADNKTASESQFPHEAAPPMEDMSYTSRQIVVHVHAG